VQRYKDILNLQEFSLKK